MHRSGGHERQRIDPDPGHLQRAIRALLALATGWDMTGRQPMKLEWRCLHFFVAHGDGKVTIERLNVAMEAA